MTVALLNVSNNLCGECSLALRWFVVGMDGIESIDVEQGKIAVKFDEAATDEGLEGQHWTAQVSDRKVMMHHERIEPAIGASVFKLLCFPAT